MEFRAYKSILVLMRANARIVIIATLALVIALIATESIFGAYQSQQEDRTLQGIESLLQDETTLGNSYDYSRRIRSLEQLGLFACVRFSEVFPLNRLFYDSTYKSDCNASKLRSRDLISLDGTRRWRIEAMMPVPRFMWIANWSLRVLFVASFAFVLFSLISAEKRRSKIESENTWLRDLTLQVKHDVASPLGALKIATQFPNLNPRLKEFLELAVDRTGQIFDDLGKITDIEAYQHQNFDAAEVIKNIVTEKHSSRIHINLSLCPIEGSKKEFGRAISNLINNSLEADPNSEVRISIDGDAPNQILTISDTGPGFPDQILKGIRKNLTLNKQGGSGLGLYHAQEVFQKMGLSMKLYNSPLGATIEVALSVQPDSENFIGKT